MAQQTSTSAWTALVAAASLGAGCSTPASTGAGGSGAGGATVVSTSAAGPGPSSTHATTATSASSGTGVPFNCDPAAAPGSLYENSAVSYALDTVSMCQYRGDVLLIIDTAAA